MRTEKQKRVIEILNDIKALNACIEAEDATTAELGLSDHTFWQLEREDILSYFSSDYTDGMNEWLLASIELVVEVLGGVEAGKVVETLSVAPMT